jgi:Domain of unknown function (DUF4336)
MDNQFNQSSFTSALPSQTADWDWRFWPILPLYPYGKRRTLRQTVVPDTIWTFDQVQGILYTVVPIRMTVVKLAAGGLLAYAPVAPTAECIRLIRELEATHGAVKYIILPTSSGLEHKIFVGPFARQFPQAQVFVAPNQWSFPFKLPLSWLGFPPQRTQVLPAVSWQAPFADEFDYAILDIDLGQGSFAEVPLLHRPSNTLLVTDSLISIPAEPPALLQIDPYPLLFHARDSALEPITDTPTNRMKGWQRICLFAVYFRPSALESVNLGKTLREAWQSPDRAKRAYFGLYPFCWKPDWLESFALLQASGRPFVAPILQTLIFPQAPRQVLSWADRIATWEFEQVVPCHFSAPIAVTPRQFRQAFSFLERNPQAGSGFGDGLLPLPDADFEFIREIEATLIKRKIALPPKEKV